MAETIFEALPAGTRILEFEIERAIGHGGFSIVYLAMDHSLGRRVALKEYLPSAFAFRRDATTIVPRSSQHRATFDAGMRSFIQEARLLAQFEHPALVKVFRFWEANGSAYMAMGYYEGPTLRELLKRAARPASEDLLRSLLASLLDAVQLLHDNKCFHRDIAPDNIIVQSDGTPVLLDFGAARRIIGDMTQALTAVLKPGYAPVEQYAEDGGLSQGPWTDVYALSATLYDAITGRPPPAAVGRAFRDDMVLLANAAIDGYSVQFLRGIDAGLALRPEDRPKSIAEFRAALGLVPRVKPWDLRASSVDRSTPAAHVDFAPRGLVEPFSDVHSTSVHVPSAIEPVQRSHDDQPTVVSRPVNRGPVTSTDRPGHGVSRMGAESLSDTVIVTGKREHSYVEARSSADASNRPQSVHEPSTFTSETVRLRRQHEARILSKRHVPVALAVFSVAAVGAGALYFFVDAAEEDVRPERAAVVPSAPAPAVVPSSPAPAVVPSAPAPAVVPSAPAPAVVPSAPAPANPTLGEGREPVRIPPAQAPVAAAKESVPRASIAPSASTAGKAAVESSATGKILAQVPKTGGRDERQPQPEPSQRPPDEPRLREPPPAPGPGPTATVAKTEAPPVPPEHATPPKARDSIQQPADASEQFERGRAYASGSGVSKDLAEAASWYRRAANQGHAGAQVELGRMLAAGRGVAKNEAEAVKWYRAAAEQGHAAAQSELGYMYANGRGVDRNDAEALRLYRIAADKGYATAMNNLGWMYENGFGVVANDAEATRWYRVAAATGNALAQNNLGRTYIRGRGVPPSDVLAAQWYRKAADQQYAPAQDNLGFLYENGRGVMRNEAEALKLYQASAEQGNSSAQFHLGRMYEDGRGVAKDQIEAAKWYRKAAALGNAAATERLMTLDKIAGK